jgi:hypothetical protein
VIAPVLDPNLSRYVDHYVYPTGNAVDTELFWGSVSGSATD